MSRSFRIALFCLLVLAAALSGWRMKASYEATSARTADRTETDLTSLPDQGQEARPDRQKTDASRTRIGAWGAALVLSIIGAGIIAAHEFSQFVASRAVKALYNEEGVGVAQPDYEKAEDEWAKGNYLVAIELMREYLAANPREQHVTIRIAEIYEKDLANPLAAALEYEEVLRHKLAPERWGWAAIHLCNIYSGKLGQPEKAIDLLHRIVADYGTTAAGKKARARLQQLADDGVIPPLEEVEPAEVEEEPPSEPPNTLPPGFAPKKR